MIIFCDIDGVLFDISHRLRYQQSGDYESFYSDDALAGDSIINGGVSLVRGLIRGYNCPYRLCFVTGRPERTRTVTERRLQYLDIDDALFSLHMRENGDYRPSPQIKVELIGEILGDREDEDIFFIDDDPSNVKAVCDAFPEIVGLTFGTGRWGGDI